MDNDLVLIICLGFGSCLFLIICWTCYYLSTSFSSWKSARMKNSEDGAEISQNDTLKHHGYRQDTTVKSNQRTSPSCVPILSDKSDRRNNPADASLAVEALAIGNRSRIRYGKGNCKLSVKPPGPCPRCKDYRHWHWEKDCQVAKCKRCHKIGHKSTRCPARRRQDTFDIDNHSAKAFPSVEI